MKPLRKLAAVAFFVMLLITALLGGQLALVPHTVENGEEITRAFAASSKFIESFQQANQRLPEEAEFDSWQAQQKSVLPRIESVKLISANDLPLEVQRLFGPSPANSFALSLWRGEWHEHYAGWSNESTIDSPLWLYAWALGLLLISASTTVALWKVARGKPGSQNLGGANE